MYEIFRRHRRKAGGCSVCLAKWVDRKFSSYYSSCNLSFVKLTKKTTEFHSRSYSVKNRFDDKLRSAVTPSELYSDASRTKAKINFFSAEKRFNQSNFRRYKDEQHKHSAECFCVKKCTMAASLQKETCIGGLHTH